MSTNLTDPIFNDEDAARKHFEAIRWPNGPECPKCGTVNEATLVKGKSHRPGMYQCNACREPFTVTVGSVMESSHVPLHKWALGFHLMAASKKGVSAHQLMRMLGLGSYRTAWFLAHRIREAMSSTDTEPMGGSGKTVEADETYIGRVKGQPKNPRGGSAHKNMVMMLVERGGSARSFHIDSASRSTVESILRENVKRETALMTDEALPYRAPAKEFASHDAVNHGRDEYVRREKGKLITTNTVEGYYSVFKRGMKGVYQHCGERHLHRYLYEFDFRYSNRSKLGIEDTERATKAIVGAGGKRLTYQVPRQPKAV